MKQVPLILALLLTACIGGYNVSTKLNTSSQALDEINQLYSPWTEKAFCVSVDQVYNVIEGDSMSVSMPVCLPGDIPFHTHPWYADGVPSPTDNKSWRAYANRYSHKVFGIMLWRGDFKLFELKEGR